MPHYNNDTSILNVQEAVQKIIDKSHPLSTAHDLDVLMQRISDARIVILMKMHAPW
jgi:hypothetical protein